MGRTYPENVEDLEKHLSGIASRIFGNRFKQDQTLYEYLVEFLLVFVSAKNRDLKTGKLKFHESGFTGRLEYYVEPRVGLRRFIFFDKSKKGGDIPIDEYAYREIVKAIKKKIDVDTDTEKQDILDGIQDLLHGYAIVVRNRNWCAQSLLPVCPEMVLCDTMPEEKKRRKLDWWSEKDRAEIDKSFSFDKRNFLARGGELYYLHILQALENKTEEKEKLEILLAGLLGNGKNKLSDICNMVEKTWESLMEYEEKDISKKLSLSFIPVDAYIECGEYSVIELENFLSSDLPAINKIEILAKGIMYQIMRMMSWQVDHFLGIEKKAWIVDMKGGSTDTVKKIAADGYSEIESDFMTALNKSAREIGDTKIPEDKYMSLLNKARLSTLDLFRTKGKELQCIIPTNGRYERFSLSEDVIRFLVLSLIPPQGKMTLNMFLEKLKKHYNIIIGPEEYRKYIDSSSKLEASLTNSFAENQDAFQAFLKATGFLRELSDATSIVVNPYSNVMEEKA